MAINKEIVVLSEEEHIIKRPEMWVGSIRPTEEKIPLVINYQLIEKNKTLSVGMYKLFDEILDNAIDEAKRQTAEGNKKIDIIINIDTKLNLVKIQDNGGGFKNADKIHNKTGKTNVETALSQLRAGSNFENEKIEENIIGTNGVGAAIVNVLSDYFYVKTTNNDIVYEQSWKMFKSEFITVNKKTKIDHTGTLIEFIPRKEIFKKQKWDLEILTTKLIFKNFLLKNSYLKQTKLILFVNNKEIDLNIDFIPQTHIVFEQNLLKMNYKIYIWKRFQDSCSISFINDAMCQGIHQRVIFEEINNKLFEYEKAHYFYETFIVLNLPPKYVKFGDQNKTKFVSTRSEISELLNFRLSTRQIKNYQTTELYQLITDDINNQLQKGEIKKLKKAKKEGKVKVSDKYFPSEIKEDLFITEGLSASGSLLQERDPKRHGVYSLRGKIKNAQSINDLSSNKEIIDLMNILDLDVESQGANCKFKKIIIAVDQDPDGIGHIASLIINFFYKWFPKIITSNKLFILQTPLISVDTNKVREYFYSLENFASLNKASNVRYLKGLGSLDLKDWRNIFSNMHLFRICADTYSDKILDIAFGSDANKRKKWLQK